MGAGNKRYGTKDRKQFNNDTKSKGQNFNSANSLPLFFNLVIILIVAIGIGIHRLWKWHNKRRK